MESKGRTRSCPRNLGAGAVDYKGWTWNDGTLPNFHEKLMDTAGPIIHGGARSMDDEVNIPGFQCTRCGKCCVEGASRLSASAADLAMWAQNAPHVLAHVAVRNAGGVPQGDLWISPRTGRGTVRCPWIRKHPNRDSYYCRIYEFRPEVCRRYPTSPQHAALTDCPGITNPAGNGW